MYSEMDSVTVGEIVNSVMDSEMVKSVTSV